MNSHGTRKRKPFKTGFLIYFIPLIIIVSLVLMVSIDYYNRIHSDLVDNVFILYRDQAERVASEYRNLAENVELFSSIISHSPYLQQNLMEMNKALDSHVTEITKVRLELMQKEFYGIIQYCQIFDRSGRLIFSFPGKIRSREIQRDVVKSLIARTIENRSPLIQSYGINRNSTDNGSSILFTSPVFFPDDESQVSGVLCCWVDLDSAHREFLSEKRYNHKKTAEMPEIFFLSNIGNILFHTGRKDPSYCLPSPADLSRIFHNAPPQGGTIFPEHSGISAWNDHYYIYTPLSLTVRSRNGEIKGPDYGILFVLPQSVFYKRFSSSLLYIILTSILLFLVLVIPWFLIYKALYRAEKERNKAMEHELKVAYDIQVTMLPEESVKVPGFDIYCKSVPARHVGGDFYDYIHLPGGNLFLIIGDASGKGVPGALMMTVAKSLINFVAGQESEPGEILRKVNDFIEKNSEAGRFVTVLMGHLDLSSRVFRYVLAGHEPPLLCRRGTVRELDGAQGRIIGCFPDVQFETRDFHLEKDDVMLLYTDGCTDVWNEQRELINFMTTGKDAVRHCNDTAQSVSSQIFQAIEKFEGHADQHDDRTLIVVKVLAEAVHHPEMTD